MTARTSDDIGVVFSALADPTRRRVLDAVAASGTATATELAATVPVTRQAVAKHLSILEAAGLVECERSGRHSRYCVVPGSLTAAAAWIESTEAGWSGRFGRLRRHLEARSTSAR